MPTAGVVGSAVRLISTTTTTTTTYYGSLAESVNGTLSYLLADGLGSVSASVNLSGQVTATQLYAPYGSVRYSSGILPADYGFTHQRADAVSGLDDYGARYYDPVAGQFTSADTTLVGGGACAAISESICARRPLSANDRPDLHIPMYIQSFQCTT